MLKTVNIIQENGLTIKQERIRKYRETVNSKEWKETIGKEVSRKRCKTINSQEWIDTIGKDRKIKELSTKRDKSILKFGLFDIFNSDDELIHSSLTKPEVQRISQVLLRATKEKPMGSTRTSKIGLNKYNNLHFIFDLEYDKKNKSKE